MDIENCSKESIKTFYKNKFGEELEDKEITYGIGDYFKLEGDRYGDNNCVYILAFMGSDDNDDGNKLVNLISLKDGELWSSPCKVDDCENIPKRDFDNMFYFSLHQTHSFIFFERIGRDEVIERLKQ